MSSWEGWSDPIGRQATPQPKGPPKAVLGPPIDNPYGFLVAEETFEKVTRRVKYAGDSRGPGASRKTHPDL